MMMSDGRVVNSLVPPADVLSTTASEAVKRALEEHRAELVELVERQVETGLERLAAELVAEAIARGNGGDPRSNRHRADEPAEAAHVDARRANETLLEVSPAAAALAVQRRPELGRRPPRRLPFLPVAARVPSARTPSSQREGVPSCTGRPRGRRGASTGIRCRRKRQRAAQRPARRFCDRGLAPRGEFRPAPQRRPRRDRARARARHGARRLTRRARVVELARPGRALRSQEVNATREAP
jgi:hypothetical protein